MGISLEIVPISTTDEVRRLGEILCQCFNSPLSDWAMHCDRLGLENFRLVYHNGEMVGGVGYYPMGQWFGGQCVPLAGVAAVGIAPEHRGSGIAVHLMRQMLQAFTEQGLSLSALHPTTQTLYRKVGYEQAGTYCHWELPLQNLVGFVGQSASSRTELPMYRITAPPESILLPLYRQQAQQSNGYLERHPGIWKAVFQQDAELYIYGVGDRQQPQGYMVYSHHSDSHDSDSETHYLEIWDWAATSAAAMQRLWEFVATHATQMQKVRWHAGISDPRLFLLPQQTAQIRQLSFWMLRIVNLKPALESRGYAANLSAELHLMVNDFLFPHNQGKFILTVTAGTGKVTSGGKGELQLEIRALAPLYTGLMTPSQLQHLGLLAGCEDAIATAAQIFNGQPPAMVDFF